MLSSFLELVQILLPISDFPTCLKTSILVKIQKLVELNRKVLQAAESSLDVMVARNSNYQTETLTEEAGFVEVEESGGLSLV